MVWGTGISFSVRRAEVVAVVLSSPFIAKLIHLALDHAQSARSYLILCLDVLASARE